MKRPMCFALILLVSALAEARQPAQQTLPTKLPEKKQVKPAASPTPAIAQAAPGTTAESNEGEGKSEARRVQLDPSTTIRLNYGFPAWNKDPAKIDSASILMREGASGRLVQIYLEESEPSSSVFSGLYSINWRNMDQLQVEFYVPPQELLGSVEGMKKVRAMLDNKELKRRPFILRRTSSGVQTIEIFDTKEQAMEAMKAFRAEQQVQALQAKALQAKEQAKKFPSDEEIEMAKLAQLLKEREAAAKSLSERVRLAQVETRRLQDMLAKFYALPAAEREARKKEAAALSAEAMEFYKAGKFPEAEEKFDKAVELDPESKGYYFQYGVTLHRTEKYNRSIVFLQLADDPAIYPVEREFYTGLNFFRLKEYANAIESFDKVGESKDANMAPSAFFYKGVIYFEQKEWEKAQPAFQKVLDISKDPKLDERAEQYLENILRTKQYENEKKQMWQISATIGEMYDSNILLNSDSSLDQGTATNSAGYRSLLMGGVKFRPIYEETREFAANLNVLTMYTVDKSFQGDQNLRNSDPTVATLTLPWTYKGLLFGKGYKLDVTPGYETIYMSIENNENKEILSGLILNFSNLLVMNNNWFANYNLEMRNDTSKLLSSTGENDSSALKVKLANTNLVFLTEDKTKMMTSEVAYTLNQAKGKNSVYNRIDLSVGYLQPIFWDLTGNVNLGYFQLNYPQKADSRSDSSYTLTAGVSRKLTEIYSAGFTTSYNINNSTVDANTYKKFTGMLTLSALVGL